MVSLDVGVFALDSATDFWGSTCSDFTLLPFPLFASYPSLTSILRFFSASVPSASASKYSVRGCIRPDVPLRSRRPGVSFRLIYSRRLASLSRKIVVPTSICISSRSKWQISRRRLLIHKLLIRGILLYILFTELSSCKDFGMCGTR